MKSRGQRFIAALVCLLTFTVGAVGMGLGPRAALSAPATPAGGPALTPAPGAEHQITLDVVVSDRSGKPMPGLQQQDFTVLDNKQPRTISSFSAVVEKASPDYLPEQSMVLVDAVNSPPEAVAFQRQQLDRFLRQGGGELPLPMSLSILTDKSETRPVATRDGNGLANSLDATQSGLRVITGAAGFYGGVERFQISLEALNRLVRDAARQSGRKLVIRVGPGWPLLSVPGITMDQEQVFSIIVRFSTALRQARVTLYNVNRPGMTEALAQSFYYENFLKGVSSAKKVQYGNLALQVLAVQSGGRVLNTSNDLGSSIAACLADAQVFYTLAFAVPAGTQANEYHSLQVKMNKPGLAARTRTGYYAQP